MNLTIVKSKNYKNLNLHFFNQIPSKFLLSQHRAIQETRQLQQILRPILQNRLKAILWSVLLWLSQAKLLKREIA
jgi:hypothetical protein